MQGRRIVITGVDGDVYRSLQTLLGTPVGTLVNDREYGINWDGVDYPPQVAEAMIVAEVTEKVQRYEPRASVNDINSLMEADGSMVMEVVVSYVNQE